MKPVKRIFVCSPYAGQVEHNVKIAQAVCRQVILEGHAPFAPHLHYPGIVDDSVPQERDTGIKSGLVFMSVCDEVWAFVGNGITPGMTQELEFAKNLGIKVKKLLRIRTYK